MYSRSSDGTLAPFEFGVTPKPIRGYYFREEKNMGEPKERRRMTMSRDFLRKLLIKLNTDQKRGI